MELGVDVHVAVLGGIEAGDENGPVALSPQLRRLLGLLVTADGGTVSTDRLAEYIADGAVEGSTVRTAVSRLRKVLGDRVESVDGGYRLVVGPEELDAARFAQLVERSRSSDGEASVAALSNALALWRGPALGDLATEEWAQTWAARLDGLRAGAVEELAEQLVSLGRERDAVELLDEHVRSHPYRERPVGVLMRALAVDGRVADALRVFERFRVTLRDDTGLEPSADLRAVETELLAVSEPTPPEPSLPTGTVTFVFTDIEGSTQRWAEDEHAMTTALADHDAVLRDVVAAHGGTVFKHTGDGICAVFASAPAAVNAAIAAQTRLELPVRIGLHTGEAELRAGDYFGPTLNRVARIMDAGHGGQILVSRATAALVADVETTDLGEHRLKGLAAAERIVQIGTDEFPPLRVATARKGNLPTELTTFVGRDEELQRVTSAMSDHRLVTLFGVGGTGKTRLAVEAASSLAPLFPDGCWIAELARISVPEAVPVAICVGLGISPPGTADVSGRTAMVSTDDVTEHVVRRIRHERRLLVVDNCEHLVDAAADMIERIVAACPNVSIVATSREPLMIAGEHLVPTPSLAHDDAVRLFLERARGEAPALEFDDRQRAAVDELCERLDRLPLAIELAASRMRSMSPSEAVERLDERFRLLVGGRRSRMERHSTMRGTVEWSYELCDETEQRVFERISVFAADFDLGAAAAVASSDQIDGRDVDDAMSRLVDRSLVQCQLGADGATRFRLLETMRAYGHERLVERGEAAGIRAAHARYVSTRVGELSLVSLGPSELEVHAELRGLAADSLLALDWFIDAGEWERAYATACSLYFASPGVSLALLERMHEPVDAAPRGTFDEGPRAVIASVVGGFTTLSPNEERAAAVARYLASLPEPPTDHWAFGPLMALNSSSAGIFSAEIVTLIERWLDHISDAPPVFRFMETIFSVEDILLARRTLPDIAALAPAQLSTVRRLAEQLDSDSARSRCVGVELLIADATGQVGDVLERARRAIDRVVEPSGGDIFLAARYLRLAARVDRVTGADLVRPLDWSQWHSQDLGIIVSQISTVVALAHVGNHELAERLAATLRPDDARAEVARLHRANLTDRLFEQLTTMPASVSLDEVLPELRAYAEQLDRQRPAATG